MSTVERLGFLATTDPPWIVHYPGKFETILQQAHSWQANFPSALLIILDGRYMRTMEDFFDELTKKFELPDYFGRNWDALDEVLTDLNWIEDFSAVVVLVRYADEVLKNETCKELATFMEILRNAGKEWSHTSTDRPTHLESIPFHTILVNRCDIDMDIPELILG